jgi:hypothetical protein
MLWIRKVATIAVKSLLRIFLSQNNIHKEFFMERIKKLLDQYEHADLHESLCLFLQHRDLRDDFQKIELNRAAALSMSISLDEENNGLEYNGFYRIEQPCKGGVK